MRNKTSVIWCGMVTSLLLVSCGEKTEEGQIPPGPGEQQPQASVRTGKLEPKTYKVCDVGLHADHPTKFTGEHLSDGEPIVIEPLDRVTRVKFGEMEHKMIRIGDDEELAMLVELPHKESNAPADAPPVMVTHLVRIMNATNYPGTKCNKAKTIIRIAFCVEEEDEQGKMKWMCSEDIEGGHLGDVHGDD